MRKYSLRGSLTRDTIKKGMVVAPVSGRDRFRTFIITDTDYDNQTAPAVLADGSLHKFADRKHKNPAHLRLLTDEIFDISEFKKDDVDVQIAEICSKYDFSLYNVKKTLDN